MAIRTETYILNGREFTRTWSDANRYVVRDDISYEEANDPSDFNRIYIGIVNSIENIKIITGEKRRNYG